jgi:ribosome-associated protein
LATKKIATTKKRAVKKAAAKKVSTTVKTARKAAATPAPAKTKAVAAAAPAPAKESTANWLVAVQAAESKKATDIQVLDLREVTSFADFFVICTGSNPRQVQAIAEEIDIQLAKAGEKATSLEGFKNAEWVLADYGDMIVHVFSPKAREFYELERLWRHAKSVEIPAQ